MTPLRVKPVGTALALAIGALALFGCTERRAAPSHESSTGVTVLPEGALPLHVFVGSDGVAMVGGEPFLDDTAIQARAEAFHAKHPHAGAEVRSTQAALHGRTVRVLDLLREAELDPIHVALAEE